jgi:hypothetical protein
MNMPESVDIDLLPLYRRAGQDQSILPGLQVARRPRRPARSRESDQLFLYLSLVGNVTVPLDLPDQLLVELAKTYYETSGSVTAALRITAETLNKLLLKRNMQSTGGQQTIGLLTLATLRGDQLYLAQCGPVYAVYLATGQAQELNDPALSGRGLGINQSATIRYFYTNLRPGDVLLLSVRPPSVWNSQVLSGLNGLGMESQQRRLLEPVMDANAVLCNVKPGSGVVTLLSARPVRPARGGGPTGIPAPAQQPTPGYPVAILQSEQILPLEDQIDEEVREQALLDQYQPLPELDTATETGPVLASEAISVSSSAKGENFPAPNIPVAAIASQAATTRPEKPAAGKTGRSFGRTLQTWFNRLLPEETLAAIPNSVFAFMAIAVPLAVVAMATAVYFQRGLAAQSEVAYAQAVQAVQQAQVQTDPLSRRNGLDNALKYLAAADTYRKLPETQVLRQNIYSELDSLDLVRRLDYQSAIIGNLPSDVRISRITVADTDLYLLDSQAGKVYRAFYTNQGYQLDPGFQCGPGSPTNVGPLIDLSAWPLSNDPTASVVAMDAKGMLLFCSADKAPLAKKLPDPPTGAFTNLAGFTLDQTDLYLLDPQANSVWVYWSGDFEGEPAYYFGDEAPSLQNVIDLTATHEELYLLHADGQMAVCVTGSLGDVTPNRCTDPTPYIDMRIGREGALMAATPAYSQVQYSTPPDPSLYLLDGQEQAVDRYSLRNLTFQRRYLPDEPFGYEATAAWVDPIQRLVFLAIGSKVYYANFP